LNHSRYILVFSAILHFLCINAQEKEGLFKKIELGFHAGPMLFLGDLGGSAGAGTWFFKDADWEETKMGIGAQLNFYPTKWISLRTGIYHGAVSANDRHSPNVTTNDIFRFNRNLHFRSRLDEVYLGAEFYPFRLIPTKRASIFELLQPYIFTGMGLFRFNPQAKDIDGVWVDLQPLRLEGQGFAEYPSSKPDKLIQQNVLSGAGVRFYINEDLYIGTEIIYRKVFTDQIDNVSAEFYVDPTLFDTYLTPENATRAKRLYYQGLYNLAGLTPANSGLSRGNPNNNDSYIGQSIQVGFRIYPKSEYRFKCPTVY
jgi:hypothetical protein